MNLAAVERDKYSRMWNVSEYREYSPGEQWLPTFLELVGDQRGELLDAGCGTGRAGKALAAKGFDVTLLDVTDAGLEVSSLPFMEGSLWDEIPGAYQFGYCCDVMEHIPREYTMLTLSRLLDSCRYLFLSVATQPDQFGVRVGEPLHLTVEPFVWWRDRLRDLGEVLDARDCLQQGVFYLTR